MPLATSRAFVLASMPMAEQDKLVHLLTRDRGLVQAVAPGAMKSRNRFGAMLEMLTEVDIHFYWKEEKNLITLTKGDLVASYFHVTTAPGKIFHCSLMAEILTRCLHPNQADLRLYRLLKAVLDASVGEAPMSLILLYFMVWVLRLEGIMFNPERCSSCQGDTHGNAWIRTDFRGTLCGECHDHESLRVNRDEIGFLTWSKTHPPGEAISWRKRIDPANLLAIMKTTLEHHNEISLMAYRYLTR